MNLSFQDDCKNIPWEAIPLLLKEVDMSYTDADIHKQSFEASFAVVFVFDGDKLIAFGRMISDGVRQSALYDIAVTPAYQGNRIGQQIVERLIQTTPACNIILYAAPGKESFYKKLNFGKMKTGMARFVNQETMIEKGFVENE